MPRTLGAGVSVIPSLGNAEAVYLVELQFSGATVRYNTGAIDLSWNGFTWVALGGAMEVDPVTETADDRGQGLGLKLSGVDQSVIAILLAQEHKGRLAKVWLAHLHTATNFIDNPELRTVITGWAAQNGVTIARDTTIFPPGGVASVKATYSGPTTPAGVRVLLKSGSRFAVVPGTTYTYSINLNGDSVVGGTSFQMMMQWFDGAAALLSSPALNITRLPGWNRYSVTFQAPATAATVHLRTHLNAIAPGDFFNASEAKLEAGSTQTLYEQGYDAAIVGGTVAIDPIPVFVGYMNEGFKVEEERDEQGANGTVTISTRLVSRLAVLAKVRGLRTNVESHQTLFAGDLFFKFVSTLTHKRLKWGG